MKHYGDITKLNGAELPVVDIITGGSPCQDLSVAGKRAGLAGERSGLFMEQIRIIKEMRENDRNTGRTNDNIRPRWMVWENVPGAFSSGIPKGGDFRCVLEETAKVAERDACIPEFDGKWPNAGCIMGNGWSIAWRVHDAQFWGVPQRRKRIALVADFGGETAPEILFERKSMSGNTEQSGTQRETIAADAERSTGEASSYTLKVRGGAEFDRYGKRAGKGALIQTELSGTLGVSQDQTLITKTSYGFEPGAAQRLNSETRFNEEKSPTLRANMGDNQAAVVYGISSNDSNAMKSSNPHSGIYEAETARTLDLNGGSPACNQGGMAVVCLEGNGSRPSHQGDGWHEGDPMYTLNSTEHHAVCAEPIPINTMVGTRTTDENRTTFGIGRSGDPQFTLSSAHSHAVAYRKQGHPQNAEQGQGWEQTDVNDTLNAFDSGEMRTPTVVLENHPADSRVKIAEDGIVQTLSGRMGTGGGNVPMVMEGINGETAGTLDASYYKGCGERQGIEREVVCIGNGQLAQLREQEVVGALNCMHDQQAVMTYQDKTGTVDACIGKGTSNQLANQDMFVANTSVVRRLTPMECERLQGFPDHWTDIGEWVDTKGKLHKDADSPRYKALGNSIALPFWAWMAHRMVKYIDHEPTMASLFDGISGFCLVFARAGVKPVFSSEIEEFPIAVAKKHFGDDDLGLEGDYERYL